MRAHKRKNRGIFLLVASLVLGALFVSGCTKNSSPVPAAGSRATTKSGKSDAFTQTARSLQQDCARLGCTCFLDGIQTTCAVVFACLDAGFCELVKATN
jgi:hypothetical protein